MLLRVKLFFLNLYFYTCFLLLSSVAIPMLTLVVAVSRLFLSHRRTMKRFRRSISFYGKLITSIPYPWIKLRYEDLGKRWPWRALYLCMQPPSGLRRISHVRPAS